MRGLICLSILLSLSLPTAFAITGGAGANPSNAGSSSATDLDLKTSTQLRLLEMKYFEHTFDSDSVEERTERLENLIRGEVGEGSPSDRIKSMVAALQADGQSLAPLQTSAPAASGSPSRGPSAGSQPANSRPAAPQASQDHGDYPHVTNLEREILGPTHEGEALSARLDRLEMKAFGKATNSTDLSSRTDRLEAYAQNTLHDQPFANNPDIDKTYIIPASRQSYPTARPDNGPSLADAERYAVQHFFGSSRNMGQGYSPSVPMDAGSDSDSPAPPPEDPAVFAKTPPLAGARMITQVGWCEVQVFGHTFPNMHLTQRLRQLNDEVMPRKTKLTDMQLMDDLTPIMTTIVGRKQAKAGA